MCSSLGTKVILMCQHKSGWLLIQIQEKKRNNGALITIKTLKAIIIADVLLVQNTVCTTTLNARAGSGFGLRILSSDPQINVHKCSLN